MAETEVTNFQYQLFLKEQNEQDQLRHTPASENWKLITG